jgi:hypothetical protein
MLSIQPISPRASLSQKNQEIEKCCLLGYDSMYSGVSSPTFRRNVQPQFSKSNGKITKLINKNLAYTSTLKMEKVRSSATSMKFYHITLTHIPEYANLHSHHARFEAFTAVTMKNVVFWDMTLRRSSVNRRFGGTCRPHLHSSAVPPSRIFLPSR